MSEKVESGLEVVAWAHPDYCDVITDSPTRTIEWERRGASPIPLVRQSDAERALQLEMERHRKTWRQLEQVTGLLRDVYAYAPISEKFRIDAALSQQPEPIDTYTAVDMATAAAQGFRDGQAAVEQAPAQDELAIDTAPLLHFIFSEYSSPEMAGRLPDDVVRVVRALEAGTRPAQTEQQPVARVAGNEIERYLRWEDGVAAFDLEIGAKLYAAPIAQTAQRGEA